MTRADFVILGAGPAGLGAALRLATRNFRVVILEKQYRVGGLAASFEVAGQRVDFGSHRLHPSTSPEIMDLLRARLGDELQHRTRRGRIRLEDRWIAFPPDPADLVRSLPWSFLLRAGAGAALAALRPRKRSTYADFVTTGLGRVMGESFYFPYARKIWGLEPQQISGEQARRRISADTPWRLVRRIATRQHGSTRSFYYPAGGFGRIAEVLAEAGVEAGVELRLAAQATSLDIGDSSVTVTTSTGERIPAGHVWSTIPLNHLAKLVVETPDDPAPRLDQIRYRAMLLVYLVAPVARYTPFDAHYFPSRDISLTRLSEPKNYRDGSADPADRTVLCAEIPCSPTGRLWAKSDQELGALVTDALERCGLPNPRPIEVVVRRLRHAYPIYRLGHGQVLDSLIDWIDCRKRLLTFGRQGLFAHDNTHHALAMAWAAAEAVDSGGEVDARKWAATRRTFENHIVED